MRRFHHNICLAVIGCVLLASEIAVAQFAVHVGDHGFRPVKQPPSAGTYLPLPPTAVSGRQPQQRFAAHSMPDSRPIPVSQAMYVRPQASANTFPTGLFDSVPAAAAAPFAVPRGRPVTTPVLGSRTRQPTAMIPFPTAAPLPSSPVAPNSPAMFRPTAPNSYVTNSGNPPAAFEFTQNSTAMASVPAYRPPITLNTTGMPQAGRVSSAYAPTRMPPPIGPQLTTRQDSRHPETADAPIHVYPPDVRLKN